MNTGLLPGINLILTILAVMLCFVPMALYWARRLAPDKVYLTIAAFWTINGITYVPEIFHWHWYQQASNQITIFYNLIDTPLSITLFFYIFRKKFFVYLLTAFIVFEFMMIAWKGLTFDSNTPIIGVGSLICLILNVWGISRYFMKVEHSDKENVLVFVYAGYIFYYGIFLAVVYIFNYLNPSGAQLPYVTFMNWIDLILATGLISYGIWRFAEPQYHEERY